MLSGLPGAGKTTLAKQLENSVPALRLCPDEWVITVIADINNLPERDRTLLMLRYHEGVSFAEASARTGRGD